MAVRRMAAFTPLHNPNSPSDFRIVRKASNEPLYLC